MRLSEKFGIAAGCVLLILLLSSCVDVEYKISINSDHSADVTYQILMNPLFAGLMQGDADQGPLDSMRASAQANAYTVSDAAADDKTGFKAEKHIENLEKALSEGDPFGKISEEYPIEPGKGIKIKKGFFSTTYTIDSDIDLTSLSPDEEDTNDLTGSLAESIMQSMKLRFILNLPQKAENTNAATIESDGQLLTWNLVPGQVNKVQASVSLPNKKANLELTIGIAILAIIVIISLALGNKRKRSQLKL